MGECFDSQPARHTRAHSETTNSMAAGRTRSRMARNIRENVARAECTAGDAISMPNSCDGRGISSTANSTMDDHTSHFVDAMADVSAVSSLRKPFPGTDAGGGTLAAPIQGV